MIFVFGSINADLVTSVDRHPLPGETVAGSNYQLLPGGKGANQALAARRSGADVTMIGSVGTDSFAGAALANLSADGIDLKAVQRKKTNTGVALIAVAKSGENTIIVIPGANGETKADQFSALRPDGNAILVTQNELNADELLLAHVQAAERSMPIIHNPAPAAPLSAEALKRIDYLIVNETEALLIAVGAGLEADDPVEAARLLQKLSGRSLVVTLGASGALGIQNSGETKVPAFPVDVVDTTGAGDSFVGAFAAALDRGADFASAIRNGVAAGSLACRILGAQSATPTRLEIEALLQGN